MFKALLKSRLGSLGSYMTKGRKKNSKFLKWGLALIFAYVGVCMAMMFGFFFEQLVQPFHAMGIDWLYFTMMMIMAFAMMVIGSIFMTQSQLYQAGDNELLLSMPVPTYMILLSRLIIIYLFNFVFELLVFIPGIAIYCYQVQVELAALAAGAVIALFLPLLSMTLSCVIGWILELITSKMRNKSMLTMVLSISFLVLYFYGYSKVSGYISLLIANGETVASKMKGTVMPLYWAGNSLAGKDVFMVLVVAVVCAVPFMITYYVLNRTFINMVTTKHGFAKKVYKEKKLNVSNVKIALLKKELTHFLASPVYMLNATIGSIITAIAAVLLIVKRNMVMDYMDTVVQMIPNGESYVGAIFAALLCAIAATNIITAPSISLEGKNLWIVQSMPIDKKNILMSKIHLHMVITEPVALLAAVVVCIVFKVDMMSGVLLFVLPLLFNLLCAVIGLIINLHVPNFDWISETVAIKQSASTMLTMLACFMVILIPGAIYIGLCKEVITLKLFEIIVAVVYLLVNMGAYYYLMNKGTKKLENL